MTVVPLPPTDLQGLALSTTQVGLSWTDRSTNETGFKVQRKTGTEVFKDIATVNADVTNYTDNGLTPNTTYVYRVYTFNSVGNSLTYTNEVTVTSLQGSGNNGFIFNPNLTYGSVSDNDGNTYKTIQIGTQVWMAENLRTSKYRDGSAIPLVTSGAQWGINYNNNTTLPMMCWYNNDKATYSANKIGADTFYHFSVQGLTIGELWL